MTDEQVKEVEKMIAFIKTKRTDIARRSEDALCAMLSEWRELKDENKRLQENLNAWIEATADFRGIKKP